LPGRATRLSAATGSAQKGFRRVLVGLGAEADVDFAEASEAVSFSGAGTVLLSASLFANVDEG
jgi:hypothetical protein